MLDDTNESIETEKRSAAAWVQKGDGWERQIPKGLEETFKLLDDSQP